MYNYNFVIGSQGITFTIKKLLYFVFSYWFENGREERVYKFFHLFFLFAWNVCPKQLHRQPEEPSVHSNR
jgi:hypothetical protein